MFSKLPNVNAAGKSMNLSRNGQPCSFCKITHRELCKFTRSGEVSDKSGVCRAADSICLFAINGAPRWCACRRHRTKLTGRENSRIANLRPYQWEGGRASRYRSVTMVIRINSEIPLPPGVNCAYALRPIVSRREFVARDGTAL